MPSRNRAIALRGNRSDGEPAGAQYQTDNRVIADGDDSICVITTMNPLNNKYRSRALLFTPTLTWVIIESDEFNTAQEATEYTESKLRLAVEIYNSINAPRGQGAAQDLPLHGNQADDNASPASPVPNSTAESSGSESSDSESSGAESSGAESSAAGSGASTAHPSQRSQLNGRQAAPTTAPTSPANERGPSVPLFAIAAYIASSGDVDGWTLQGSLPPEAYPRLFGFRYSRCVFIRTSGAPDHPQGPVPRDFREFFSLPAPRGGFPELHSDHSSATGGHLPVPPNTPVSSPPLRPADEGSPREVKMTVHWLGHGSRTFRTMCEIDLAAVRNEALSDVRRNGHLYPNNRNETANESLQPSSAQAEVRQVLFADEHFDMRRLDGSAAAALFQRIIETPGPVFFDVTVWDNQRTDRQRSLFG